MSTLTREVILGMPTSEYVKLISTQEGREAVEAAWNQKPEAAGGVLPSQMSEEERQAVASGVAVATEAPVAAPTAEEQAEADRVAAEAASKAEADKKTAEEVARKVEEAKPKKRFVMEYQATDAEGNNIGRLTHLESETQEGLLEKMKTAHINAVRAYERLKQQKITRKPEEPAKVGLSEDERAQAVEESRSKDPATAAAAIRKLVGADELEQARQELEVEREKNRQIAVSLQFLQRHPEFNNCKANVEILGEYTKANELEWTLDNLEYALVQVESQLAPKDVPQRVTASAPANPEPAQTPAAAVTAVPAIETPAAPVAPAPTVAPAAAAPVQPVAPNQPAAVRKVPSGGIVPGSMAGRPSAVKTAPVGLTKQDIAKMDSKQLRLLMRDPVKRAEIERVANSPSV